MSCCARGLLIALAVAVLPAAGAAQSHRHGDGDGDAAPGVPMHQGLGQHRYPIRTSAAAAQAYFDQGLRLYWAFNHGEAVRSFAEAERIDPTCAMCVFGLALALGPNINAPMDSAAGREAWAAVRRGEALAAADPHASALLAALAQRYDPGRPRADADSAWAQAIGVLADRDPGDHELQLFRAEALMDLSPWRYWTERGEPRPATPEILRRVEQVLRADPDHPGACHLLIHAVEARDPARALPCAERLAGLMPGAGHLVHMPGHIYIRVGRYADAIRANQEAVHADQHLLEGPAGPRQGLYALGYYPHNWHFLSFAAAMAGERALAVRAARQVVVTVGPREARQQPWLEAVTPVVYTTLVTFGEWDAVLAEPLPPADLRFTSAMAYYARGTAFAARHRWAEAGASLDSVRLIAAALPPGDKRVAASIAAHALAGEVALRAGRAARAVGEFREAVRLEDGLAYSEPPAWYYPVRQSLGKALLAAGRPREAERTYREDLERFPENGWSLFGLMQSLARQRRTAEWAAVADRFAAAWQRADVQLTGSRF